MNRFVLVHGFTQTARSWRIVEQLLHDSIADCDTLAVDLPGHGDSTAPADLDLWAIADRLVDESGDATYVGYSMGGRVALHAALARPDAVRSLVLIGATAGIDEPRERRARLDADEELATRIETVGVEAFIDEWLRNPLFAGLDDDTALRSDRLRNTAAGLAGSLRAAGTGTQEVLWDRLGEITVPVLLLVGEHDAKFADLAGRLRDRLGDATLVVVPDAGHSVHLEQPAATVEAIGAWYGDPRRDERSR